jgi:hypothetical protein
VPRADANATVLSDGQVLNVDRLDPSLLFLFSGGPVPAFIPLTPLSLPFAAPPAPITWCGQLIVIDPSRPSFLSLSQGNQVDVVPSASTVLSLSDDATAEVLLCAGGVPFYGTVYDRAFVVSNGRVTFNSTTTDFSPSLGELNTGPPSLGFWTDLNPFAVGTISYTRGPTFTNVAFTNVPYFGETTTVSFRIGMQGNGVLRVFGLHGIAPNPLIGTSSGGGDAQALGISNGYFGSGVVNAPFPFGMPVAGGTGEGLVDFWNGMAGTAPAGTNLVRSIQTNIAGSGMGELLIQPVAGSAYTVFNR